MRNTDDDIGNSWLRRPRAMISLNPNNGCLPGTIMEPQKRYRIDLFIDVSGSVTDEQCQFFANFANLIPRNKWEVHIHSFNTEVHGDIELSKDGRIVNLKTGGGTSFDAVARFVLTANPTPDNVVVVTDGEDKLDSSLVHNHNAWSWIIDNDRYDEVSRDFIGKVFSMKSITKELRK
jgi:predicted metal-dependent peptidase